MSPGKIGRKIWHTLYYGLSGRAGASFALRCREVTRQTDLGETPAGGLGKLRYRLHLSLCQACANYSKFSIYLGENARIIMKLREPTSTEVERINMRMLREFGRKP